MVGLLFIAMNSLFCHSFWEFFFAEIVRDETLFIHRLAELKTVSQWHQLNGL